MAAVQLRNGSYRVIFRYRGKQHSLPVGKVDEKEARAFAGKVDYLLLRIEQKLVTVPPPASPSPTSFSRTDRSSPRRRRSGRPPGPRRSPSGGSGNATSKPVLAVRWSRTPWPPS